MDACIIRNRDGYLRHDIKEADMLQIEPFKDLIQDDRGNYYTAVHVEKGSVTLVNAAVERSYRMLVGFTEEYKRKFADYEHQFIGKMIMDLVRHDVVFAIKDEGQGRLYDLHAVEENYQVDFINMIEFYRHPREAESIGE